MSTIHHINLAGLDLNLLVVFDALMTERHVTRAGARIGLSQPATSNALARLRNLLGDELFVRTASGLQPTARAIALEQPMRQVLLQIQVALTGTAGFAPETSDRTFTLGMSDYGEFVLLPQLLQTLKRTAPSIKIQVRSSDRQLALKQLDRDEVDLAIGVFPHQASWHRSEDLFQEQYVCVSSRANPKTRDGITLEDYVAASHLLVSPTEDMTGRIDSILAQMNLQRQVVVSVPHFLIAPFLVADTELIVSLAERVARAYANLLDLRIHPLPFASPGFTMRLLWHAKHDQDPAHQWLRTTIATVSDWE